MKIGNSRSCSNQQQNQPSWHIIIASRWIGRTIYVLNIYSERFMDRILEYGIHGRVHLKCTNQEHSLLIWFICICLQTTSACICSLQKIIRSGDVYSIHRRANKVSSCISKSKENIQILYRVAFFFFHSCIHRYIFSRRCEWFSFSISPFILFYLFIFAMSVCQLTHLFSVWVSSRGNLFGSMLFEYLYVYWKYWHHCLYAALLVTYSK